MTIGTLFQSFDMRTIEIEFGEIVESTESQISILIGDDTIVYTGAFLQTELGTAGRLDGIEYFSGAAPLYSLSGIGADAAAYFDFVNSNDIAGVLGTLFGGADRLNGSSGADFVFTLEGNDSLYGGRAADQLFAQDGADALFGQRGRDLLDGGRGADQLDGGLGDDSLFGGQGGDSLDGGAGDDELWGNAGADLLYGRSGSDTLLGGRQADTLLGGQGADVLGGGKGPDVLTGGRGLDQFLFRPGEMGDRITDFALEVDRLVFEGVTDPGAVSVTLVEEGALVTAGDMSVLLEGFTTAPEADVLLQL